MKLTIIIITTFLLQVSANTFAQRVSLEKKGITLKDVFREIRLQTGYNVFYSAGSVKDEQKIDVQLKDIPLEMALRQLLRGQSLDFIVKNRTVVISQAESSVIDRLKNTFLAADLTGLVTDANGHPLPGATIRLESATDFFNTKTSDRGTYAIMGVNSGKYTLSVSYIGYQTTSMEVIIESNAVVRNVKMQMESSELSEVVIANDGYQKIPKERSTGSFLTIGKEVIDRGVGTNIMSRLEGLTNAVDFDRRAASQGLQGYSRSTPTFSVRGLSTLAATFTPLIVVDNFPFAGNLDDLNPNDIESVTILKDAAAASIWGARASNGVVVITTKNGKLNSAPRLDFNSSVTVGSKPDLYSARQISTAGYIEVERNLFGLGYYDGYSMPDWESYKTVTPVIQALLDAKDGKITQANAELQIAGYASADKRDDLLKYFYRNSLNQQYSASIKGGTEKNSYYFSLGYDNNRDVNMSMLKRTTLTAGNMFAPVKNLQINIPIFYSYSKAVDGSDVTYDGIYPYADLTDDQGNGLNINYVGGYNKTLIDRVSAEGLYDLSYSPLSEFRSNQRRNYSINQLRINPSISFKFLDGFTAQGQFQYQRTFDKRSQLQGEDTFYTRNLISTFAQVNDATGAVSYPIRKGGILQQYNNDISGLSMRGSLSYNHTFRKDHQIDAIAGYERNEYKSDITNQGLYGFNSNNNTAQQNIDYNTQYLSNINDFFMLNIPTLNQNLVGKFNAVVSTFANAAYTYKGKYVLSASGRIDQANLFGVSTNNRRRPLWSTGLAWNIDRESFYHFDLIPQLKLRTTFGYQGNTVENISALTTVTNLTAVANSPYNYSVLSTIPNPDLRWEKVGQFNVGLDFGFKNNIVFGSFEYYNKDARDLISSYTLDPTSGSLSKRGNVASMKVNGMDLILNSNNFNGKFKWQTRLISSYNKNAVTSYLLKPNTAEILSQASLSYPSSISPIIGNAAYGVYSLKWAGLDPSNGDPQGYDENGAVSKDYATLLSSTKPENLIYHGSATPVYYGGMLNNFSYKGISASINITYKAGYYFHEQGINYSSLFGATQLGSLSSGVGYEDRWKKPGDEQHTGIPSMPTETYPDSNRDAFYQASSVLVHKADNIRLSDFTLAYRFNSIFAKRIHLSNLEFYTLATLNKVLWTANKAGIDPDYTVIKPYKSVSIGLRASL